MRLVMTRNQQALVFLAARWTYFAAEVLCIFVALGRLWSVENAREASARRRHRRGSAAL
jgi:hypothetical protein